MMFHACVRGMDESITDSLTGQSSSGGVSLNSQSSGWFKAFLCSCCCNVLLLIAVSYLVWYAIFRPPTDTICALDYRANLAMVQDNVTAVVQKYSLANATQDQIDCYLALYKKITFDLANYSDDPVTYQWKMQLGSDSQMAEAFAERQQMMAANHFQQLYDLLMADGVWAYLYSQYFPEEDREKLMLADMHETSMMVTMVKMPECIDDLVHTYRLENYEKLVTVLSMMCIDLFLFPPHLR